MRHRTLAAALLAALALPSVAHAGEAEPAPEAGFCEESRNAVALSGCIGICIGLPHVAVVGTLDVCISAGVVTLGGVAIPCAAALAVAAGTAANAWVECPRLCRGIQDALDPEPPEHGPRGYNAATSSPDREPAEGESGEGDGAEGGDDWSDS